MLLKLDIRDTSKIIIRRKKFISAVVANFISYYMIAKKLVKNITLFYKNVYN